MPAMALTYLWKPLSVLLIIAALIAYRAVLIHQRDAARASVASLTEEATGLRSSNAALQAAIQQQNAAVDALAERLRQTRAQAQQQEQTHAQRAAAIAQQESARANAIKNSPVPPGCDGAIKWGNAQGPELGQW